MKNTKAKFYVLIIVGLFWSCASDETVVPKISVFATDFVVNKSVEAVQSNAGAIVTKYTYDIVEAYVISSDENGNFFKTISLKL
jgi:hypothetical protein